MNALDAARATAAEYPGGAEALALRMGMSGAVLRGKLNPANERNQFYLADAEMMLAVQPDHRLLHALAASCGYTLQPMAEHGGELGDDGHADADVLGLVLIKGEAAGDLQRKIYEALADGVITPNEMMDISRAGHSLQRRLLALIARLAAMVPRSPR